jgi:putative transport protein
MYSLLASNPLVVVFLILGLGILLGKLRVLGVPLGSVTGVLLVGLAAGHLELEIPRATHNIGFLLFIYCIGVQAGPEFVGVFRRDGARYAVLALLTAALSLLLAQLASSFFQWEPGVSAGLLAGALTSTPTLVAAQDAVAQGLTLPPGVSSQEAVENISSAYAITYVFGLAGLVLFVSLLPRLLRIDIAAEARHLGEGDEGPASEDLSPLLRPSETPVIRSYRVDRSDLVGVPFAEIAEAVSAQVQQIKRGEEVFTPGGETCFEIGDIVAVVGLAAFHEQARARLGTEVIDPDVLDRSMESRRIVLSRRGLAGQSLAQLGIGAASQCWLTELRRGGAAIPRRPDLELRLGDVLVVTGPRSIVDQLAERLGAAEHELSESDLLTLAFGIALGVLVGTFSVTLGTTSIGLGSAGGVLLAGLGFGLFHSYRPDYGRLPAAARYVLMELGLLLFMSGVAVSAGHGIVETFHEVGWTLALCGVVVTLVPVGLATALGRYVLRMNAALLLGAVTGAMTSTAALRQVTGVARSNVPMLGYVGTYAFANVLLAIAGGIIMRL